MIEYSDNFLKEAKKLSKKFKLIKSDLKKAIDEIETKKECKIHLYLQEKVVDLESSYINK